jgi:CRISPR type III-B/RAMP module RAMP protein Cmr1
MRKISVRLEAVTPLFLGGADNRTPELRPPPFRGMMRYWFRALAGGVLGDDGRALKTIRQKESEIFGSPDEKRGQSAVWVRLSAPKFASKSYLLLPHKDKPKFSAIPPGVTPTLTLTLKPNAEMQRLELAVWSLLVGLTVGGIGKRSRRGFGSLRVVETGELPLGLSDDLQQQLEEARQPPANAEELAKRIGGLLIAARSAFTTFLGNPVTHINDLPRFSLLKSDTHIVIWTPKKDLPSAYDASVLAPLMSKLSSQMAQVGSDFAEAFGGINIRLPNTRDRFRRASPLWVSTHRLQNDGWALVLTHLKAQYLHNQPGNQHHLVTEFLNSPPEDWARTEVTL